MGYRFIALVITVFVCMHYFSNHAIAQEIARPLNFSAPQFQIEDLSATVHSDGRLLLVNGKVKNLDFSEVRGFVTVYLKNSNHSVLKAVDVEVNDNKGIPTGQTGSFETSANIENIRDLANISVEFTETGRSTMAQ